MDENLGKENNEESRKAPLTALKENENTGRKGGRLKKRKKNGRKISDPMVKTVTDLMSHKLTLKSPNSSLLDNGNTVSGKTIEVEAPERIDKGDNSNQFEKTNVTKINAAISGMVDGLEKRNGAEIEGKTEDERNTESTLKQPKCGKVEKRGKKTNMEKLETNLETDEVAANGKVVGQTSKINAFAMMMGNRNRSMGRNSPGKSPETPHVVENKSVKAARRKLLQDWADAKGASKRKREYDEVGNCINEKLERRAKKLKKLLKIENHDDIATKKRKERSTTDSDTEIKTRNAFEENKNEKKTKGNRLKTWKMRIKLGLQNGADDPDKASTPETIAVDDFVPQVKFKGEKKNKRKSTNRAKSDDSAKKIESSPQKTIKTKEVDAVVSSLGKTVETKEVYAVVSSFGKTIKTKEGDGVVSSLAKTIKTNEVDAVAYSLGKTIKTKEVDAVVSSLDKIIKTNEVDAVASSLGKTIKTKEVDAVVSSLDKIIKTNEVDAVASSLGKTIKTKEVGAVVSSLGKTIKTKEVDAVMSSFGKTIKTKEVDAVVSSLGKTNEIDEVVIIDDEVDNEEVGIEEGVGAKLASTETESTAETVENGQENRRVLRTRKPKVIVSSDDDDYEPPTRSRAKKEWKVAPVFVKSTPKPKEDPKVVEARRQFLLSGVPSFLKVVKQSSQEEVVFDEFPTVSHVQQKSEDNLFWNLPEIDLKLRQLPKFDLEVSIFTNNISTNDTKNFNNVTSCGPSFPNLETVKCMKSVIRGIKAENPNYPVYRVFKALHEKSGSNQSRKFAKRRGRKKKNTEPVEEITEPALMWTEKYKPSCFGDILGNTKKIVSLKTWLENFGKKSQFDSGSDFDDGSSRNSSRSSWNTMILVGPSGSGKTMAVYAICNELNYNVLEVNASSKRTGKKLLQDLQEATRSHQVRKNGDVTKETPEDQKLCVLLVEDIDVVFEQDEGFFPALAQIAATSKRPLILTTTDANVIDEQKFLNQFETVKFSLASHQVLGVWVQIVCLIEGIYVELGSIRRLLDVTKGDVRSALLQLQFWAGSGGEFGKKPEKKFEQIETNRSDDSSLSIDDVNATYNVHSVSFENSLVDLEGFWWSLPKISDCKREQLGDLSTLYDLVALSDTICGKTYQYGDLQPRWRPKPKDSLVLDENYSGGCCSDFGLELQKFLIDKSLLQYTTKCGGGESKDISRPISNKLRSKFNASEDMLREALQPLNSGERCAVVLDYLPTLRTIARSEFERASNNQKRGNRFNNYLNSLGVNSKDSNCKLACDVFAIEKKS